MKKVIRTDLLRELANHLISEKLAHEIFSLRVFNDVGTLELPKHPKIGKCGTIGCAWGEAPAIWPRFEWNGYNIRDVITNNSNLQAAMDFFNITDDMSFHLFLGDYSYMELRGQPWGSSAKEVGNHILAFCDYIDSN